jgi:hypothetical protein
MRSSSEYRIEKLRRSVQVVLTDGTELQGEIFLRPVSRYRSRPEEPVDLLNDTEPFFALSHEGSVKLVAKDSVAVVTSTSADDDDHVHIATPGIPVEVTMNDGSACGGCIFPETREGRPRLLDFLNSYRDRFLPVVDSQQVYLVNTHTIAHVREVD